MEKNPPPDTIEAQGFDSIEMQDFEGIDIFTIPVTSIKTPLFQPTVAEMLTEILTSHGAAVTIEIECCLILFPEGSMKSELLPRTLDEKYKIVLPDGFELFEAKRRYEEYSYLQIDIDNLSPLQKAVLKRTVRE